MMMKTLQRSCRQLLLPRAMQRCQEAAIGRSFHSSPSSTAIEPRYQEAAQNNDDDDYDASSSSFPYEEAYNPTKPDPNYDTLGPTTKLNLFQSINAALQTSLSTDPSTILFWRRRSLWRCIPYLPKSPFWIRPPSCLQHPPKREWNCRNGHRICLHGWDGHWWNTICRLYLPGIRSNH